MYVEVELLPYPWVVGWIACDRRAAVPIPAGAALDNGESRNANNSFRVYCSVFLEAAAPRNANPGGAATVADADADADADG